MGGDMSKHGINGYTSLSRELRFDPDDIESCTLITLTHKETRSSVDTNLVKDIIKRMNRCRYVQTNYVYNHQYRIELCCKNGSSLILALSNDGKYVGKPTAASSIGLWMYLDEGTNPLYDLFV